MFTRVILGLTAICLLGGVTASAPAKTKQENINLAVQSKQWDLVERLAREGIQRNGFHFSLGHLYVLALEKQKRAEEGLATVRTWATDFNGAGGKAVLADALDRASATGCLSTGSIIAQNASTRV